jgi:hypothetical protein
MIPVRRKLDYDPLVKEPRLPMWVSVLVNDKDRAVVKLGTEVQVWREDVDSDFLISN